MTESGRKKLETLPYRCVANRIHWTV